MKKIYLLVIALACLSLSGCATNPVTEHQEMVLIPESMELEIGQKQYAPSRQMHGGDFRMDSALGRYVSDVGNRIAAVSDRKLPYEFAVLNNATPNAWALPAGKIAVTRRLLLELKSEAELAAILAHEIVHAAARHGAKSAERGLILQGLLVAVAVASGSSDFSVLAVGSAAVGANLIKQTYSREDELEADYYSMLYMTRAGYDPKAAVELQELFVKLANEKKPGWLTGLFSSHPPTEERVKKNRETAVHLAFEGGEIGSERYLRKIAYLATLKPAYELYEKGCRAIKQLNSVEAVSLAKQAIQIEPREALFHGLLGEALSLQVNHRGALAAYDEAVEKDPGFFRHHLKRGLLHEAMGNRTMAHEDFGRSIELLPTADAHFSLGRMAAAEGDEERAINYFKEAKNSSSEAGKAATRMLHRLDLPKNPDRYLLSYLKEKDGRIHVFISNPTSVAVYDLSVVLSKGWKNQMHLQVPQKITAGNYATIPTEIRVTDKKEIRRWWVRIEKAKIQ